MPNRVIIYTLIIGLICGFAQAAWGQQSGPVPPSPATMVRGPEGIAGGPSESDVATANNPIAPMNAILARARVSVADTRARMRRIETVTGEGGHFEFAGLPAGKYALEGSRSGYITAGYEQHEQYSTAIVTGPEFATEKLVLRLIESHRDRVRGWRDAHKTSGPMMSLQGG